MVDNNPFLPGGLADRSKRVLIVDDDENIRAYLSSLLIENGYLVSLAASLDEVKAALARDAYDLVVIGLVFLGQPYGGLEIIEYIKSVQPDTHAIILTSYPSTQTAIHALRLKVADYLIKPVAADELLRSVANLISVVETPRITFQKNSEISLSNREQEVLALLFKGYPFAEVAEHLSCTHATAKTHSRRIYKKLGVTSRSGAIYEALSLGLIQEC